MVLRSATKSLITVAIRICVFSSALLALFGCSINVSTAPTTPNVSSTNQDEQIARLEQELNEVKKQNEERVSELESELRELQVDDFGKTTAVDEYTTDEIDFAKRLVETIGVLHEEKGFRYVPLDEEELNIGGVVSYEVDNGSNGILVVDRNDIWLRVFEPNMIENCDTLYGADIETIEQADYLVEFSNHLCLSSNNYPTVFRHAVVRLNNREPGSLVLMEMINLYAEDDRTLNAFVKTFKGVRLVRK